MSIRQQDDFELKAHAERTWQDFQETVAELERRGWAIHFTSNNTPRPLFISPPVAAQKSPVS